MFIVVPFISSTGLVVVAEANLRCGDFFVRVFIRLKDSAAFLGLIMHCLLVISTWECLVFDFSIFK